MKNKKGPKYLRFFAPILDVLKELGGSGRMAEVTELVIEKLNISENELQETLKNGYSKVRNQVEWARFYLAKGGLLDSSKRGVWSLSEKGLNSKLTEEDVYELFREVYQKRNIPKNLFEESTPITTETDITPDREDESEITDYRFELLNILKSLPPNGFERICQRLLRESGFEQVTVTGKSGDGGIDGHGILQVNPFVSFRVLFQCKRFQGFVTPSQVRDFRGAMQGRADKGIIITTGSFTKDAQEEARRDGVPPIELVDGEKLVGMFELLELGLNPQKTYSINHIFFNEFTKGF